MTNIPGDAKVKRTTLEMFREELVRTGAYETPPERMAARPRSTAMTILPMAFGKAADRMTRSGTREKQARPI